MTAFFCTDKERELFRFAKIFQDQSLWVFAREKRDFFSDLMKKNGFFNLHFFPDQPHQKDTEIYLHLPLKKPSSPNAILLCDESSVYSAWKKEDWTKEIFFCSAKNFCGPFTDKEMSLLQIIEKRQRTPLSQFTALLLGLNKSDTFRFAYGAFRGTAKKELWESLFRLKNAGRVSFGESFGEMVVFPANKE